jgi:hypothetical protein
LFCTFVSTSPILYYFLPPSLYQSFIKTHYFLVFILFSFSRFSSFAFHLQILTPMWNITLGVKIGWLHHFWYLDKQFGGY